MAILLFSFFPFLNYFIYEWSAVSVLSQCLTRTGLLTDPSSNGGVMTLLSLISNTKSNIGLWFGAMDEHCTCCG
jgi:hypothetical protein